MKAIAFSEYGDAGVLEPIELEEPQPSPDEVVVRVGAVSVGRTLDIAARAGRLPFAKLSLPHVLGAEHAGEVVSVGEGTDRRRVGERVAVYPAFACTACRHCRRGRHDSCPNLEIMGIHRQGAYAEYTAVPSANAHPIPNGLGDAEAGALALSGPVAWNQFDHAGVEAGTWLLVQGAGSALGSMTAALGIHRGARVIATSRDPDKRSELEQLGAEAALDWRDADFVERVRQLTGGEGVDVAIDDIGAEDMFATTLAVLARGGTIVTSGAFVGGSPPIDLRSLYTMSQSIIGLRTANYASVEGLWGEVEKGLRPVVDRAFELSAATQAHEYVERDENFGRVLLIPD